MGFYSNAKITLDYQVLNGESLPPMIDASFYSVVCIWTLCSMPQVNHAIAETYRFLRPSSKFLFIEHGFSQDPKIQVGQNRLTSIQKIIADDCLLNRNIKQIVEHKFQNVTIEQFCAPKLTKLIGYISISCY